MSATRPPQPLDGRKTARARARDPDDLTADAATGPAAAADQTRHFHVPGTGITILVAPDGHALIERGGVTICCATTATGLRINTEQASVTIQDGGGNVLIERAACHVLSHANGLVQVQHVATGQITCLHTDGDVEVVPAAGPDDLSHAMTGPAD